MKKIILMFFLILSVFTIADERDHLVHKGSYYQYNDIIDKLIEKEYRIIYNEDNDMFLNFKTIMKDGWIYITEDTLKQLRINLDKYIEWEKIASEKEIKISKSLPDSQIKTNIAWEEMDKWYSSTGIELSFIFHSGDAKTHFLIMHSNKVRSIQDKFSKYQLDEIYLEKKEIEKLISVIEKNNLEKTIKKIKQDIENEKLFK